MNLLLDTHIALWAVTAHPRLPASARQMLEDPTNDIWVSAASIWEISIKHAKTGDRPGGMQVSGAKALEAFKRAGFEMLQITAAHAAAVDGLPPLHHDPFDRMIVIQAVTTPLRLVTADAMLGRYSDGVIVV